MGHKKIRKEVRKFLQQLDNIVFLKLDGNKLILFKEDTNTESSSLPLIRFNLQFPDDSSNHFIKKVLQSEGYLMSKGERFFIKEDIKKFFRYENTEFTFSLEYKKITVINLFDYVSEFNSVLKMREDVYNFSFLISEEFAVKYVLFLQYLYGKDISKTPEFKFINLSDFSDSNRLIIELGDYKWKEKKF